MADDSTALREPATPPPVPTAETVTGWMPYFGLAIAFLGAFAAYIFVIFADLLPWPAF